MPELDGIRAVSILLVLAAHGLPLGPKALQVNYAAGLMGMSLFFCLSGFLITSILMRNPDALDFLARRMTRIVPSIVVYLSILLLLGLSVPAFLVNLLFIANYVHGDSSGLPVGHLWSLSVEVQFYVAIGLTVFLFGRQGLWLIAPACLAVTAMRVQAGAHVDIATHLRVDEILIGGCLALAAPRIAASQRLLGFLRHRAAPLILGVAVLWIASSHPDGGRLAYLRPYFAGILVGLALFAGWAPLRRLLFLPGMAYVATISYALYIYHPLMMAGFMNEGGSLAKYLIKRPISFAATFAAAHLSTFHWERRWTDALRARRERARAAPAPLPGE